MSHGIASSNSLTSLVDYRSEITYLGGLWRLRLPSVGWGCGFGGGRLNKNKNAVSRIASSLSNVLTGSVSQVPSSFTPETVSEGSWQVSLCATATGCGSGGGSVENDEWCPFPVMLSSFAVRGLLERVRDKLDRLNDVEREERAHLSTFLIFVRREGISKKGGEIQRHSKAT
jgi:hypothetical protein